MGNYRHNYLKGKYRETFICVYCGKPMSIRTMTVDHIIPQSFFRKVKSFIFVLALMAFVAGILMNRLFEGLVSGGIGLIAGLVVFEIKDLKWNLTSACSNCNRKKSNKMGFRMIWALLLKSAWVVALIGIFYAAYRYLPIS